MDRGDLYINSDPLPCAHGRHRMSALVRGTRQDRPFRRNYAGRRNRHAGSNRTWPATSSRPTSPPTDRAPASSSTTRCSTPPSSPARPPTRPCSASSNDWRAAQGRPQEGRRQGRQEPAQGPAARPRPSCCAPVLWPSAIYCAGANYADHAAEMARRMNRPLEPDPHTHGLKPWHFIKAVADVRRPRRDREDFRRLRPKWTGRSSSRR